MDLLLPTFLLQTRVVGVLCRVGCAMSVDDHLRLKVASALIGVVARPWGPLEVIGGRHESIILVLML